MWIVARFFALHHLPAASALVVTATLWPWHALALELVPGGYGADTLAVDAAGAMSSERLELGRAEGAAGMSLGFTPRHTASGLTAELDSGGPRFDLTVRGGNSVLDQLGLTEGPSVLVPTNRRDGRSGLTVGGAMHWSAWSIGGGIGRADFLGTDVDLLSAFVGYGPLSAEIAFGQSTDRRSEPSDVLMLSTDLAAWSWLTLESDLAVGSRVDPDRHDESVAVGRFGLRLNF